MHSVDQGDEVVADGLVEPPGDAGEAGMGVGGLPVSLYIDGQVNGLTEEHVHGDAEGELFGAGGGVDLLEELGSELGHAQDGKGGGGGAQENVGAGTGGAGVLGCLLGAIILGGSAASWYVRVVRTIGWTLLCACAASCSAPRSVPTPPVDGGGEGALSAASPEAAPEERRSTSDSDDTWETFGEVPGDTDPGPKVLHGKPVVDGPLVVEIVSRIAKAHTEELRHCYRKGLEDHTGFGGRLTTEFLVGGDGYVKSAKVVSAEFAELGVPHCTVTAIETWRFPKPSANGDVEATVTYRFNFVPE